MANAATSQGQLQRSGVRRLVTDRRGKEGGPGSGPHGKVGKASSTHYPEAGGVRTFEGMGGRFAVHPDSSAGKFKVYEYHEGGRTLVGSHPFGGDKGEARTKAYQDAHDRAVHGEDRTKSHESRRRRIHESASGSPFFEEGKDEKQKQPGGAVQKGRVYLVTIIEEGLGNSKDKNYYSPEALQHGIQLFNGAKAYSDHPDAISEKTLPERSMKDLVGWYSDCFTDKNPKTGKVRLRGKLHMFPDAKWLSDKIDVILTDPTAQKLFGISINAIGRTRPATQEGEQVNYVEEFQRVDSADVVTEPAARGGFDKMLESRRGNSRRSSARKVSKSVMRRTREAATLSSEKTKEIADSLVSAYNSDNPDEMKQAAFEAARVLHAASSISGKGPGQVNEEQYSNINPSGGSSTEESDMAKRSNVRASRRTKASASPFAGFRKGKRRMQAAAGTGPDNADEGEPEPSDISNELEEADVEDKEGRGELGDQSEYGGGSKYRSVKASSGRRGAATRVVHEDEDEDEGLEGLEGLEDEGLEDEGMEDEDEGMEDEGMEDEDENFGAPGGAMAGGGGAPGAGSGGAAPTGGGAPGSSRGMVASEAHDDDDDDDDDEDDLDDMDEAVESLEDEDEHDMGRMRPNVAAEAGGRQARRRRMIAASGRRRRTHEADASFSGGLGKSGGKALPKGADPSKGYGDEDEAWGKEDSSTSGVGKSYKIKTSRFSKNRLARKAVKEANRRIAILSDKIRSLRESNRGKDRKIDRYRGKMRFFESSRSALTLLREAVKEEILPTGVARDTYKSLLGLNRDEQIAEIKSRARFLDSAQEGVIARLTESVDGNGARGSVASWGTAGGGDSELVEGLAGDGIPIKQDE